MGERTATGGMKQRILELDFLKCVFILLMIVFHLVFIGDKYPHAKAYVYTFHMSAFLVISGYVMSVDKGWKHFLHSMFWLLVPYVVMEFLYAAASYYLPVRGGLDHLNMEVLLDKLFFHPLGPYWYLHTLLICGTIYFLANTLNGLFKDNLFLFVLTGTGCAALSYFTGIVSFSSVLYFMAGVILKRSGTDFVSFFHASPVALIPLAVFFYFPVQLVSLSIVGLLLTYSVVSFLLFLHRVFPQFLLRPFHYIGQRTLPVFLFSPLFTMLVKPLAATFSFDSTGLLFAVVSVAIAVSGSLLIVWIMEQVGLCRLFFGKPKVL